jgi:hypothetical protein
MSNLEKLSKSINLEIQKCKESIEKFGLSIRFKDIESSTLRDEELSKKIATDYNLYLKNVEEMNYHIKDFQIRLNKREMYIWHSKILLKIFEGTRVTKLYNQMYEKVKTIIPILQDNLPF